jgi:hypothetical protein
MMADAMAARIRYVGQSVIHSITGMAKTPDRNNSKVRINA